MTTKKDEGSFVKWYEKDFAADELVQSMTWLQRLLYRTLCQKACFCSTRPSVPNDDNQLWLLSGAESKQMWIENKDIVLQKFKLSKNTKLFSHKRITIEYKKLLIFNEGQRSKANKRWNQTDTVSGDGCPGTAMGLPGHAAATPRDAITEKQNTEDQITENQTKPDKRGSNPDGTERAAKRSATVSGSGFPRSPSQDFGCVGDSDNRSGSGQGQVGWAMTGESKSTPPKDAPDLSSLVMDSLVDKWEEVWEHMDCHDESDDLLNDLDKRDMLRDYLEANGCDPKRMLGILSWLPHSNYWGKTLDGQLKGLDGFLKAYRVIGPQYNNYMAQVSARKKKAGA